MQVAEEQGHEAMAGSLDQILSGKNRPIQAGGSALHARSGAGQEQLDLFVYVVLSIRLPHHESMSSAFRPVVGAV